MIRVLCCVVQLINKKCSNIDICRMCSFEVPSWKKHFVNNFKNIVTVDTGMHREASAVANCNIFQCASHAFNYLYVL